MSGKAEQRFGIQQGQCLDNAMQMGQDELSILILCNAKYCHCLQALLMWVFFCITRLGFSQCFRHGKLLEDGFVFYLNMLVCVCVCLCVLLVCMCHDVFENSFVRGTS